MNYTLLIIICLFFFVFSLCMLKKDKIAMFFKSIKWNKKPKKTKRRKSNNKKEDGKIKIAETQIRPILLPPSENKPLLNTPEKTEQLNLPISNLKIGNDEKGINFENSNFVLNKENGNNLSNSNISMNKSYGNFNLSGSNQNNLLSKDRLNPSQNRYKTRDEIDKEFEEVRKFLDIPSTNTIPQKKVFNANMQNAKNEDSTNKKQEIKDLPLDFVSNVNKIKQEFPQYSHKEQPKNIVKVDDDEIDLNKLPNNLKRLIISNILSRKDYD